MKHVKLFESWFVSLQEKRYFSIKSDVEYSTFRDITNLIRAGVRELVVVPKGKGKGVKIRVKDRNSDSRDITKNRASYNGRKSNSISVEFYDLKGLTTIIAHEYQHHLQDKVEIKDYPYNSLINEYYLHNKEIGAHFTQMYDVFKELVIDEDYKSKVLSKLRSGDISSVYFDMLPEKYMERAHYAWYFGAGDHEVGDENEKFMRSRLKKWIFKQHMGEKHKDPGPGSLSYGVKLMLLKYKGVEGIEFKDINLEHRSDLKMIDMGLLKFDHAYNSVVSLLGIVGCILTLKYRGVIKTDISVIKKWVLETEKNSQNARKNSTKSDNPDSALAKIHRGDFANSTTPKEIIDELAKLDGDNDNSNGALYLINMMIIQAREDKKESPFSDLLPKDSAISYQIPEDFYKAMKKYFGVEKKTIVENDELLKKFDKLYNSNEINKKIGDDIASAVIKYGWLNLYRPEKRDEMYDNFKKSLYSAIDEVNEPSTATYYVKSEKLEDKEKISGEELLLQIGFLRKPNQDENHNYMLCPSIKALVLKDNGLLKIETKEIESENFNDSKTAEKAVAEFLKLKNENSKVIQSTFFRDGLIDLAKKYNFKSFNDDYVEIKSKDRYMPSKYMKKTDFQEMENLKKEKEKQEEKLLTTLKVQGKVVFVDSLEKYT